MAKDGGPAFPHSQSVYFGMSLRDYFAAAALQGFLANSRIDEKVKNDSLSTSCYGIADAMLAERDK